MIQYIAQIPSKALAADCTFEKDGGVWVSAGHGEWIHMCDLQCADNSAVTGPWGISLSQGTGLILAEMILGKKPSISIAPYAL